MNKLKVLRDWLMVILTLIMIHSFYYVGDEIKAMRLELKQAGVSITSMSGQIGIMAKVIERLEQRLARSWFF